MVDDDPLHRCRSDGWCAGYRLWDEELDQGDRVLVIAAVAVAVLVVARQGIAIRENRMVVERERTDLVSSISHELRTPLTATVGFVAVLQEDPKLDLKERIEMIDIVMEQTVYLERIVRTCCSSRKTTRTDLYSRPPRGVSHRLIESAILSSMIGRDGVHVEVEPDLVATVDADRLQQVLVNLLANARRYGGGPVSVIARSDQGSPHAGGSRLWSGGAQEVRADDLGSFRTRAESIQRNRTGVRDWSCNGAGASPMAHGGRASIGRRSASVEHVSSLN